MKYYIYIIVLLLCNALFAQNQSVYVSQNAQELTNSLLTTPNEISKKLQLINEYNNNTAPELAYLEILELEKNGYSSDSLSILRAHTLFRLERLKPAYKSLFLAYAKTGDEGLLLQLAITDYALGNDKRAISLLNQLKQTNSELSFDIAVLYRQLFVNNRKDLATASRNILRDMDEEAYKKLFPIPQVTIIAPTKDIIITDRETALVLEINHGSQIKEITANGRVLYSLSPDDYDEEAETVGEVFNAKLPVGAGTYPIRIVVSDIYGYYEEVTTTVFGFAFSKSEIWKTEFEDSISQRMQKMKLYLPVSRLVPPSTGNNKIFMYSFGNAMDSVALFNRGLQWSEVITDEYTSVADKDNTKLIFGERCTNQNFETLFSEWLLNESNLQSSVVLYLSGQWSIEGDLCYLNTIDGRVNVKDLLTQLLGKSVKSIAIILDNVGPEQQTALSSIVNEILSIPLAPTEIVMLTGNENTSALLNAVFDGYKNDSNNMYYEVTCRNIRDVFDNSKYYSNNKETALICYSVSQKANALQNSQYESLMSKLSTESISENQKNTIIIYADQLSSYPSVSAYIAGSISVQELLNRITN